MADSPTKYSIQIRDDSEGKYLSLRDYTFPNRDEWREVAVFLDDKWSHQELISVVNEMLIGIQKNVI